MHHFFSNVKSLHHAKGHSVTPNELYLMVQRY